MPADKIGGDSPQYDAVELGSLQSMAMLGRLASGLSHELNNPSTALKRAADQLREGLADWEQLTFELGALQLDDGEQAIIDGFKRDMNAPSNGAGEHIDPLERSDREADVQELLARWGITESWQVAPTLVDWGWGAADLQARTEGITVEHLPVVGRWLAVGCQVHGALQTILASTASISEISAAIRDQIRNDIGGESRMSLNDEIDRTLTLFRSELRPLTVDRQLDAATADLKVPSELNQVWTNLIDNAIDAMSGSGTLSIRTGCLDGWIQVDIADTGSGIPDQLREHLFTPFKTTKSPEHGTGLGLSITRDIVQRHGGEIDVSSKPGKTIFTIRIPQSACEDI